MTYRFLHEIIIAKWCHYPVLGRRPRFYLLSYRLFLLIKLFFIDFTSGVALFKNC